jgi:hypothetical protein
MPARSSVAARTSIPVQLVEVFNKLTHIAITTVSLTLIAITAAQLVEVFNN